MLGRVGPVQGAQGLVEIEIASVVVVILMLDEGGGARTGQKQGRREGTRVAKRTRLTNDGNNALCKEDQFRSRESHQQRYGFLGWWLEVEAEAEWLCGVSGGWRGKERCRR